MADTELKSIKKNFNMERGPQELSDKLKTAAAMRCMHPLGFIPGGG